MGHASILTTTQRQGNSPVGALPPGSTASPYAVSVTRPRSASLRTVGRTSSPITHCIVVVRAGLPRAWTATNS